MTELDTITCMDALALMEGLPAQSVDAIITDMPYGVTACAWDTIVPFAEWWPRVRHVLKPRGVFVTTATEPFASLLRVSNLEWYRYDWVWNKNNSAGFVLAPFRPFITTENILVFSAGIASYFPIMEIRGEPRIKGGYSKSDAYDIEPSKSKSNIYYPKHLLNISNADQSDKRHPTQKPVALYEYLIKTYTNPGAIVLDPFCGSGTTAIAARNIGRHFICGDISPEYVAIAQKRLRDTDPYQSSEVADGVTQLSLFGE